VLGNSHPLLAAHGLSFDLPRILRVRESLDAIKWAVDDVRQRDSSLGLGILTLPPSDEENSELHGLYDEANRVFDELGATVLSIDSFPEWASSAVARALG